MYSQQFKEEVKAVYGNQFDKYLDNDNQILGRVLFDSSYESVSIEEILKSTDLETLKKKAKEIQRKKNLYALFLKERN